MSIWDSPEKQDAKLKAKQSLRQLHGLVYGESTSKRDLGGQSEQSERTSDNSRRSSPVSVSSGSKAAESSPLPMWHYPPDLAWPSNPIWAELHDNLSREHAMRWYNKNNVDPDRPTERAPGPDSVPTLTGACRIFDREDFHGRSSDGRHSYVHTDRCRNIFHSKSYTYYSSDRSWRNAEKRLGLFPEQIPVIKRHVEVEQKVLKEMEVLLPFAWGSLWNRHRLTTSHRVRLMYLHLNRQLRNSLQNVTGAYPPTKFTICCTCGGVRQHCCCATSAQRKFDRYW